MNLHDRKSFGEDQTAEAEEASPRLDRAGAKPSQTEAEEAVRTLLRWAGDDPDR